MGFYNFIDLQNFQQYLHSHHHISILYQGLAFFVFILNICVPVIHEVVTYYHRIKYWDYEPTNHLKGYKRSVYVKHLPHKMTQQEIQ